MRIKNLIVMSAIAFGARVAVANPIYHYSQILGGWPTCYSSGSADWSSDFGSDYRFSLDDGGGGAVRAYGDGVLNTSRSILAADTGFSMNWKLNSPNDHIRGDTYSGGDLSLPPSGDIDGIGAFHFHAYSHLGENEGGAGISTGASEFHYLVVTGDYSGQPIYYAIHWTIHGTGTGTNYASATLGGLSWNGDTRNTIFDGTMGDSLNRSGDIYGVTTDYHYHDNNSFPGIAYSTYVNDNAGAPGTGEISLDITVTLSSSPINQPAVASHLVVLGSAGQLVRLDVAGSRVRSSTALGTLPSGGAVLGTGDFDNNGTLDLVLMYDPDGSGSQPTGVYLWRYLGDVLIEKKRLAKSLGTFTVACGTSDLDRDGNLEFMLQDPATHLVAAFEIGRNGPYTLGEKLRVSTNATHTQVVGAADMDGDGWQDLILRDPATGTLRYKYLVGITKKTISPIIRTVPYTSLLRAVFGPDTFLEDSPDGTNTRQLIHMDGTTYSGAEDVLGDGYRNWTLVGASG